MPERYRVTHHLVQNLLLTSKQKFRFGLVWPGLTRPKCYFFLEVNGRFWPTWWVTLYTSWKTFHCLYGFSLPWTEERIRGVWKNDLSKAATLKALRLLKNCSHFKGGPPTSLGFNLACCHWTNLKWAAGFQSNTPSLSTLTFYGKI